jgi:cobalamin biosynthesis protein CobT
MAPVANKPSSAARRRNSKDQLASNGHSERGEQDLGREQDLAGDRDEHDPRDEQSEQWQHGDRDEQDSLDEQRGEQDWRLERNGRSGSVQRTVGTESDGDQRERSTDWGKQATANPFEAFAPTFDVTKMFATMFELTAGIAKLQQEAFASLFAATNTNTHNTNRDHRDRHHDGVSASRTSSAAPDRIEHDRQ